MRFTHDLIRESVTEIIGRQLTVRLHLRVANALERAHPADDAVAERLAYHLCSAGPLADPGRTATALARAGRRAATRRRRRRRRRLTVAAERQIRSDRGDAAR
ncbi:hypothetical protein [Micromonospora endophytica]|uniref:hypothetical protein n=1 Tax=Micromonospora endophytica TaxID=515350 RepID=UPI0015E8B282|nr:hypothetical protein [Micromonospora endophytica]